ncbi:MAG: hypothetical protein BYD32DRAFT_406327 [Podila humilis]|nr:MAG: hypothetical protein BYD32DRAFT_406327 [Podila humilis]
MVDYKPDFILKIEHPLLSQDPPGNSTEIVSVEPNRGNKWLVTLQKTYDFLRVDVKCLGMNGQRINGEYMHFIPMNGGKHVTFAVSSYALENFQIASLQVRTEHVLHDDRYAFYIVQMREENLPFRLRVPEGNRSPSLPGYEEDDCEDTDDTMSALLRDIYSVDTEFVFGPTRTRQETCLWAHRTILTKYLVFDDLIKQASFANPKAGVEPVQVTVTKVSLGTFAVLLKYIYLGKV